MCVLHEFGNAKYIAPVKFHGSPKFKKFNEVLLDYTADMRQKKSDSGSSISKIFSSALDNEVQWLIKYLLTTLGSAVATQGADHTIEH